MSRNTRSYSWASILLTVLLLVTGFAVILTICLRSQDRLEEKTQTIEALTSQVAALEEGNATLTAALSAAQTQQAETSAALTAALEDFAAVQTELAAVQAELVITQEELAATQAELSAAEVTLESVRNAVNTP